jgi:putative flippase GtrA
MVESAEARGRLHQRAGVQQLIKFCVVGATSTVIDKGSLWVFLTIFPSTVPWWVSQTLSFCLGVTNGFVWNRLWTFRARGEGHSSGRKQYVKFFASNSIGLMLNLSITKLFLILITGKVLHQGNPEKIQVILASMCAIPIVVFWNFFAAKYWTFKSSTIAE